MRSPARAGAHLHFEIPTIRLFAHSEAIERAPPDGAKRSHVGEGNVIEKSEQTTRGAPGEDLLEVHAPGFTLAADPRPDDKIGFVVHNRPNELVH